jgi:hypothetical protein
MQGGSIPPSSTKSAIYQGKYPRWTKGLFPRPTFPPDQALSAELAASTRHNECSARIVGDLRGHPRTEIGRMTTPWLSDSRPFSCDTG